MRAHALAVAVGIGLTLSIPGSAQSAVPGALKQLAGDSACLSLTHAGQPRGRGCRLLRTATGRSRNVNTLAGAALSPDGKDVYLVDAGSFGSASGSALLVLRRDRSSGRLRQLPGRRGCISRSGRHHCARARAADEMRDVAVSPDGRNVYVTAFGSDAVLIFSRRASDGTLRQLPRAMGCVSQTRADCIRVRGLFGAAGILISGDGRSVYVRNASTPSALAVFRRDPGGGLEQPDGADGCIAARQPAGFPAAWSPTRQQCGALGTHRESLDAFELAPDGAQLYAASGMLDDISVLQRDAESSVLTPGSTCIPYLGEDPCADTPDWQSLSLTASPDGRNLYLVEGVSDRIDAFTREPSSGALTRLGHPFGCDRDSECRGRGVFGAQSLSFSGDGHVGYFVLTSPGVVLIYRRDATGALIASTARAACIGAGGRRCIRARGLHEAEGVLLTSDGRNAYVAGGEAIAAFRVTSPP